MSDEGLIMIIVMQVESDEKDDIWLSLGKRSAAARSGVLCDWQRKVCFSQEESKESEDSEEVISSWNPLEILEIVASEYYEALAHSARIFSNQEQVSKATESEAEITDAESVDEREEIHDELDTEATDSEVSEVIQENELEFSDYESTESVDSVNEEISDGKMFKNIKKNLSNHRNRIRSSLKLNKPANLMVKNYENKIKDTVENYGEIISEKQKSGWKHSIKHVKGIQNEVKGKMREDVVKKSRNFILDAHIETDDEELDLPEVPSDVPEHVKTLAKNSLEKRLIKLKFFNKTWLSNSDKIPANSENLLMPPIVSTDMPSPVLKAEEGSHMKVPEATFEETLGKESETAETKVKVEPVFSSVEDQNEFNEWYAKKVESNSIKKKIKKYEPSSPCPSVSTMPSSVPLLSTPSKPSKETDAFSSSRQVVNKEQMWVVNMETVLVTMFALMNFRFKSIPFNQKHRVFYPFPKTSSTSTSPVPALTPAYRLSPTVTPSLASLEHTACGSSWSPLPSTPWPPRPQSGVSSQTSCVEESSDKPGYWQIKPGQLPEFVK